MSHIIPHLHEQFAENGENAVEAELPRHSPPVYYTLIPISQDMTTDNAEATPLRGRTIAGILPAASEMAAGKTEVEVSTFPYMECVSLNLPSLATDLSGLHFFLAFICAGSAGWGQWPGGR